MERAWFRASRWSALLDPDAWKPALAAAGTHPAREKGAEYASAREHGMHALRHFYASVLLDAGENVKALAEYQGHSDPGLTLRVYAQLMTSSQERTHKAVASVYAVPTDMRVHAQTIENQDSEQPTQ